MKRLDLSVDDNKRRLVDTFVNSVYLYNDRVVISFNCRERASKIALSKEACSSCARLGEPNWTNPKHDGASDFFVFYPGKPVFGLVFYL